MINSSSFSVHWGWGDPVFIIRQLASFYIPNIVVRSSSSRFEPPKKIITKKKETQGNAETTLKSATL